VSSEKVQTYFFKFIDLFEEGERLFTQLNARFSGEDDDSITADAVMGHAQHFFDSFAPQDQITPELKEKSLTLVPDVHFSVSSLRVSASFLISSFTLP
jgi:hypothetical protein